MYQRRLSSEGSDIENRTKTFDDVIKKKLANWYMNHSKKYIEPEI